MSIHTDTTTTTTIKQAIDGFLLSCKVEGKSWGTINCYADKLKGFLWYATNYDWPDDISEITTQHLREFLGYLRETPHRFNSKCPRAMKPINNTTLLTNAYSNSFRLLPSLWAGVQIPPLPFCFEVLRLKNCGDSLMLQRLLGHTTLMMTNRYCQAVGCYDAVESHKRYSPVDNLKR